MLLPSGQPGFWGRALAVRHMAGEDAPIEPRGSRPERMISPHVSFVMRSAGRLKHKVRAQHRSLKIPLH